MEDVAEEFDPSASRGPGRENEACRIDGVDRPGAERLRSAVWRRASASASAAWRPQGMTTTASGRAAAISSH